MDIKNRSKNIKSRLKELGYDVKLTHCQEVLATAHGFKDYHTLKAKQEPSSLAQTLDILLNRKAKFCSEFSLSTSNSYFEEYNCIYFELSELDIKKILDLAYNEDFKNITLSYEVQLKNIKIIDKDKLDDELQEQLEDNHGTLLQLDIPNECLKNIVNQNFMYYISIKYDLIELKIVDSGNDDYVVHYFSEILADDLKKILFI